MNTTTATANKSGSSQVLEYLKTLQPNERFSRVSIYLALKEEVSEGAIGGFLSRLKKEGAIAFDSVSRQHNGRMLEYYTIVDLDNVNVKDKTTPGGIAGRSSKSITTRQKLVEMLLFVAAEIEKLNVGLEDYPTRDLLKEIERRTLATRERVDISAIEKRETGE